ncbi:MAG: restriction endonuclease, partial [Clostridium sp.]
LFSTTNKYKSIDVPKIKSKDEISLILTTMDDEKIYVDCKRQSVKSSNELDIADDDETIVGKYVCERVVGSMALNNVKKGIIVTTGSIHQNALSYLDALRENTDYSISLVTMNEIVELLESQSLKDDYRITVTI